MAIIFLWVLLKYMLVNHLKKNYVSEKVTFFFSSTFSISHKKFLKNVSFFFCMADWSNGTLIQPKTKWSIIVYDTG